MIYENDGTVFNNSKRVIAIYLYEYNIIKTYNVKHWRILGLGLGHSSTILQLAVRPRRVNMLPETSATSSSSS